MVSSVPVILPPPPQHRSVPRFFSTFTPFPPFSCALFFFILGTRAVRFPSIRVESTSGRNYNKGRRCYNNDIGIARAERIWKFSNEYRPSDNCLHRDDSYIFLCFSLPFFSFFFISSCFVALRRNVISCPRQDLAKMHFASWSSVARERAFLRHARGNRWRQVEVFAYPFLCFSIYFSPPFARFDPREHISFFSRILLSTRVSCRIFGEEETLFHVFPATDYTGPFFHRET